MLTLTSLTKDETEFVNKLIMQYQLDKKQMIGIHAFMVLDDHLDCMDHFLFGNINDIDSQVVSNNLKKLFNLKGALASLSATYWFRLISKLKLRHSLPILVAKEWDNIITANLTPSFEQGIVQTTLNEMLQQRQQVFAQRSHSIFKRLSGHSALQSKKGFLQQMSLLMVKQESSLAQGKLNLICELRILLNELLSREDHEAKSTALNLLSMFNKTDIWHVMDGGALRIKTFKDNSLKVIIHPELAIKLNELLMSLLPEAALTLTVNAATAMPLKNILPPSTINLITEGICFNPENKTINLLSHIQGEVAQKARHIFEHIGGTYNGQGYAFDYDPTELFRDIAISGVLPDAKPVSTSNVLATM